MYRKDGVRDLQSIMDRCIVDEETGCWIWQYAADGDCPRCHIAPGVIPGWKAGVYSTRRVSFFFSTGQVSKEKIIHRKVECAHARCVAPHHIADGKHGAQLVATLRRAGLTPRKLAQLMRARSGQAISAETVRMVEGYLREGKTCQQAAALCGIHRSTAQVIGAGRHMHQRQRLVRGASVFSMNGASYAEAA